MKFYVIFFFGFLSFASIFYPIEAMPRMAAFILCIMVVAWLKSLRK